MTCICCYAAPDNILAIMQHRAFLTVYSRSRITLHWLSAGVIIWTTCSGFFAVTQPLNSPARSIINAFNPQLATLFIPFFAIRLALYLQNKPWRTWRLKVTADSAAAIGHGLLYLFITLVLITGLLIMPRPWKLLDLLPMPVLVQNRYHLAWLGAAHGGLCAFLALLVAGHIGAVIWHQISGHPVFNRMMFQRATTSHAPQKTSEAFEAGASP